MVKSRNSLRLPGYDYSAEGAYFVTIVTKDRVRFFGEVVGAEMVNGQIGIATEHCWREIPDHFANVRLDEFQIMPEHFHGILLLNSVRAAGCMYSETGGFNRLDDRGVVRPDDRRIVQLNDSTVRLNDATVGMNDATDDSNDTANRQFFSRISPRKNTLGLIVRTFKAAVTTWCRRNGFPMFGWQRGYYERIVRNNGELERIRHYIRRNPQNYERK